MPDQGFQDATGLAQAIRQGETSVVAVMEATLARIEERADLGAVVHVDAEMARSAALNFDDLLSRRSRRATGAPFGGVPFLMKDLGNAARDLPPLAGSPALKARRPDNQGDSVLARRFRRAGLLPFGLTTTPEFGLALTSEPLGGPIARNPWNPVFSPGGSSGGAAVAVAAGLVAIAHATDAAGSTRMPAACCGLYGLKPTRGATPNGPDFGNHLMGIAGECVVSRSIRDLQTVFDQIVGDAAGPYPDPDLEFEGLSSFRIGVVDSAPDIVPIGAEQTAAIDAAADLFANDGHEIIRLDVGHLSQLATRSNAVTQTIFSVSLANWMAYVGARPEELSPVCEAIRRTGSLMPATRLMATDQDGVLIAHALWRIFEKVDVILTPTLSGPPPRVGSFPTNHEDVALHWARMATPAPYMALANVGGIPGLAVPFGMSAEGLPLSVQLLGPMGSDRLLMALGGRLGSSRPIHFPWTIAGYPA